MRVIAAAFVLATAFAATAQAAPITLTSDPDAGKPGVAVSPDGTGHVAWSRSVASGADEVVYCRLPRGAAGCASTQTFTPDALEGFGGVRVLAPADGRVLLIFYRCCGGPTEGTSVIESSDGGQTFGVPRVIGDIRPWEVILGPGDQTVSMTNHVVTNGVDFQAAPLAGGAPGHADVGSGLGESSDFQGYWGSTAFVDAQTPIVAMSDLERVFVRTWGGAGDYNDIASWGPTRLVASGADEPKVVSGPRGVHLAYLTGEPGSQSYVVRARTADGSFAPPSLKTPAGSPLNRDLFQDDGGFLHLTWENNANDTLHYRWSRDGKTWVADTVLAKGVDLFSQRTATAPDGGGFVVWDDNNSGPVRAVPIAPKGAGGGGTGPPRNGECRQEVQITAQVIAQARTGELCFKDGKWRTGQPVVVNGLDYVPAGATGRRARAAGGGTWLTIDQDHVISTSGYQIQAGPVIIDKAPVSWDVDKPKTFDKLDEFNVKLLGFSVTGKAILDVVAKGRAQIPISVKLPKFFGGVTAKVVLSLDIKNPLGLKLDALTIKQKKGDQALFFGLVLSDLNLHYSGKEGPKVFEGTFTLSLPPAQAKAPAITATVKFADGKFVRGGFPRVAFPSPLPLAPPFAYLASVGFVVEAQPNLKLIGGAEFVGGPPVNKAKLVEVDALPPVSASDEPGGLAVTFADPTAFDLDGTLKVAGFQVGAGGLHIDTSGLFTFYAGFDYNFFDGVVKVRAGIPKFVKGTKMPGAFINFDNGTFGVTIEGSFCATPLICGVGQGGVNSRAIYGCGEKQVLGLEIPMKIGAAYEWGKSFADGFHLGCDYGEFITFAVRRQAGGARTVPVPAGVDRVAFTVHGTGAAPPIRVTGPGGVDVTSNDDPDQLAANGNAVITTYPSAGLSFVEIARPAAGTYTIAPTGSVPIADVRKQHGLPEPKVDATVRRVRGRTFEVRYAVTKAPGDAVVFSERSPRANSQLRRVTGTRGRFRFRAADGLAGPRRLAARVEHGGIPRRELDVAGFVAPGPVRPARPARVRVRRSGAALRISWRGARDAAGYVVRVRQADGRSNLRLLGRSARRFTYRGAGADRGVVTVSGISDKGREGPRGRAAVKKKARKRRP